MEYILGIIILMLIVKIFIKLLPAIWYTFLFIIALFAILLWIGVLEASQIGILFSIGGAIGSAWKFTKWARNRGKKHE